MKFKSNIEIQAGVEAGGGTGSNGQVLSSTGSGVAWINQIDVVSSADSAESIHISVKNTSGAQILKGTPVYVTGETGNSGKIEVAPADASDSAKMPALGLLESTLSNNGEGLCVQGGLLEGLATDTIDGTATTANDTVYVKPGGGLTMTKPTGTGLIQNIAKVARAHGSNGTLVVSSILRTNDVPNLTTGKIWVGDGNTTESTVVHLDEVNGRMGIGTTSPTDNLTVNGTFRSTALWTTSGGLTQWGNLTTAYGGLTWDAGYATVYAASGNDLRFGADGSSVKMILKTSGNVGIGTTSPSEKLHISGNTLVTGTLEVDTVNNGVGDFLTRTAGGIVTRRTAAEVRSDIGAQASLTNPVTGTGTTNYISKFTGSTTLGDSLIYDNGSAVGIGTTSVSNGFLNVYRSTSGTTVRFSNPSGYVDIGPNNTGGAHIYTDRSQFYMNQRLTLINGQLSSYSPNNLSFMLNSGASTAMTILNTNGNVGIGTTSPTSLLELKQSNIPRITLLKTGIISWYIGNPSQSTSNNFSIGTDSGGNTEILTLTNGGNVGIGTSSPTFSTGGGLQVVRSDHANVRVTGGSSLGLDLLQSTDGTGYLRNRDNAQLRLGTNNVDVITMTTTGNVGIGTTSPTYKLHVIGEGYFSSNLSANNIYATQICNVSTCNNASLALTSSGARITRNIADSNTAFAVTQTNASSTGAIQTWNNSTGELMRVTQSGNVGIGTTSPGVRFVNMGASFVSGPTLGSGTVGSQALISANGLYGMYSGVSASGAVWHQVQRNDGNTAVYNLIFQPSGGNVGIGTTSPSAKLQVIGAAGKLYIDDSGVGYNYYDASNAHNFRDFAGTSRLYINTSSGNVGIGTTSPSAKLELAGVSGEMIRLADSSTVGNPFISFFQTSTRRSYIQYVDSGDNLTLASEYGGIVLMTGTGGAETEKMRITSAGDVGIGTTAPVDKLDVNGAIRFRVNTPSFTGAIDSGVLDFVPTSIFPTDPQIRLAAIGTATVGSSICFLTGLSTTMAERMRITSSGNVGIGTTTPTYPLYVAAQVSNISIYADYDIVAYSDQSVKENIRPIENALERVIKSRGVLYDRIDSGEKDNIGFIAQELEVAFPELVVTNEDGTKAVKYQNAVAVLFEAVKEQQKQIDEIKRILNGITN